MSEEKIEKMGLLQDLSVFKERHRRNPRYILRFWLLIIFAGLLTGLRWLWPERSLESTGLQALLDALFTLGLWLLVASIAVGAGHLLLRKVYLEETASWEALLFQFALGMGIIAYGILALGLAGWLNPVAMLAWLTVLGLACFEGILSLEIFWRDLLNRLKTSWRKLLLAEKFLLILSLTMLFLAVMQALAPPWAYDALMYHLPGAAMYLNAGRIFLAPDMVQANGPFAVQMLFALGLAFRSDSFAQLVHLGFAVALAVSTYLLARRLVGPRWGVLAVGVILATPMFPLLAAWAYSDMAWALFETLALIAALNWAESRKAVWLVVMGGLLGLALGTKYQALGSLGIAAVLVLAFSNRQTLWKTFGHLLLMTGAAILVAMPWYLKNWVWTGNVVYPLFFGGPEWPSERVTLLTNTLRSFGNGHGLVEFLLLPWNLYARYPKFSAFFSFELLSFLFPIAALYPLARRRRASANRTMDILAVWTLLRVGIWSLGSQQTRYLLPVFPLLGVFTVKVLESIFGGRRQDNRRMRYAGYLVAAALAFPLAFQLQTLVQLQVFPVVAGFISKDDFLRANVSNYRIHEHIRSELPQTALVLMMWDARTYYCGPRCVQSADQSHWTWLQSMVQDPRKISSVLFASGVTHLLLSQNDAAVFAGRHDPEGAHALALSAFLDEFVPACAEEVYEEAGYKLFMVTCGSPMLDESGLQYFRGG